jgi:outer membrane protein assembly factor BamB
MKLFLDKPMKHNPRAVHAIIYRLPRLLVSTLLTAILLTACKGFFGNKDDPLTDYYVIISDIIRPRSAWARTVVAGLSTSIFNAVAADGAGNVYAAGEQSGGGTFNYGNGAAAAGAHDGGYNAVLVKYNAAGNALWARSTAAGSGGSYFNAVAADGAGNIYAAGNQSGTGTVDYGNGVTAAGIYNSGGNAVLVKYNAAGNAQWARTVVAGSNNSGFNAVAVDGTGNVYAAGSQAGAVPFDYGYGVTATGAFGGGPNAVLVKYNAAGTTLWARTADAGSDSSVFAAVAVDGAVYAAGYQGAGLFDYGYGVTAAGASSGQNAVLVKYDTAGTTQWAQSTAAGSGGSRFYAVAADGAGNVYAAGHQDGNGTFNYGGGVTADGAYVGTNVVLVKYNAAATPQWAQSGGAVLDASYFAAVAVDGAGNVYAAGSQAGTGTHNYGNGKTAAGVYSSGNAVLVKYNAAGKAQWARTVVTGSNYSAFEAVAADGAGNVYAAGAQNGNGTYNYGNGQTATGAYAGGTNPVLVKYPRN